MGGRFVALHFGAGVDGDLAGAACGDGLGVSDGQIGVFKTQTHFSGEVDVFGQPETQLVHDLADALGLAQQDGAALVFVDGGGGAAEVEVYGLHAEAHGFQRVFCHHVGIAAEQLGGAGDARRGAVLLGDFGDVAQPCDAGMDGVGDADEFAHAFVVAADACEQVAHGGIS